MDVGVLDQVQRVVGHDADSCESKQWEYYALQSSLQVLLATRLGERVMQPLLGCNLDAMIFEQLDTTLKREMRDLIQKAILYFEPRINIDKIDLESSNMNGVILITVNYTVRSTNTRGNLVFPFYLSEI